MFKDKLGNKIVKYGIKKFSFGIASVSIGALVFLGSSASAHEETHVDRNVAATSVNISNKVENYSTQSNISHIQNNSVSAVENRNTRVAGNLAASEPVNSAVANSAVANSAVSNSAVSNSTVQDETRMNQPTNNSLNVLDRRTDDNQSIASLLTNIINKNTETNTPSNLIAQDAEAPVEKGTKIISRLTAKYAEDIAKGYIGLEGGKYDSLIYKKTVLNPDGDEDGDGIANKDELYIYKKDGRTYLGYDIHPRLADTDGDGLNDKEDRDKLIWNISARDMAMFMNLAYESDENVKNILSNKLQVG